MHCWAPTVLSPDGKPFDKKLIKVSLGLPTVNVLIIASLYGDKNPCISRCGGCCRCCCWTVFFFFFYMSAGMAGELSREIWRKQHVFLLMIQNKHGDSVFSVYASGASRSVRSDAFECFHLVAFLSASEPTSSLPARTFTMPSGQSGRTLWNVPTLSNRFQVLWATGQPPHQHPILRVLCDRTQQSKHPPFSSKEERGQRATKWIPVFKVQTERVQARKCGKKINTLCIFTILQLSRAQLLSCFLPELKNTPPPSPSLERQRAPENWEMVLGDSLPH